MPTVAAWTSDPFDVAAATRLTDDLGVSPPTAAILTRRGLGDPDRARAFLAASDRSDPFAMHGVAAACDTILDHVQRGSRVAVFGDYDVDGVSSTAIMVRCLRALGADPLWQLPSRDEGYGLSEPAVRSLAATGAGLLVTVDCGVTAVAEVALARELGLDVVVTDHHRPGPELPDCTVVHPALGEPGGAELCAAGVALALSHALRERAGLDPAGAEEDLDLAGLATVCDMVPLVGENRRIAREGLVALGRTRKPGMQALMRVASLEPADVDARAAGFRLGPRINAAGRLGRADAALELLLTEDDERAETIARELDGLNHDRRETEARILSAADAACADQLASAAIVVAGEGWHPGVVGIVASRLVERHRRPCVVVALDGESGRGSGRSIGAYDLHEGLSACSSHLLRFGGHSMAAGVEVEADRVGDFRAALAAHAGERLAPGDLARVQRVDAVVPTGGLTLELAEELEALEPFGAANPAPALLVPAARVEHVTAVGEDREHARFSLAGGGARARGIAFRTSQQELAAAGAEPQDVTVGLERNRWNGVVEASVVLRSLCPTRSGRVQDVQPARFWEDFDRELSADPARWWAPAVPAPTRELRDRRGAGVAGVAGELLGSGESVLLVVAEVERRRGSLEAVVAGLAPMGLPLVSWHALGSDPQVAEPFAHLLAVDPPPIPEGVGLLTGAPGGAMAHAGWGPAECEFALGHWRSELALREPLVDLWRAVRDAGTLAGSALERALTGEGAYPRSGATAARMVRVMGELGLVRHDAAERVCHAGEAHRTDLGRSTAQRAYMARLAAAERYLAAGAELPLRGAGAATEGALAAAG